MGDCFFPHASERRKIIDIGGILFYTEFFEIIKHDFCLNDHNWDNMWVSKKVCIDSSLIMKIIRR